MFLYPTPIISGRAQTCSMIQHVNRVMSIMFYGAACARYGRVTKDALLSPTSLAALPALSSYLPRPALTAPIIRLHYSHHPPSPFLSSALTTPIINRPHCPPSPFLSAATLTSPPYHWPPSLPYHRPPSPPYHPP